ncbi:MAG: ABC transporter ATP-binding protein [Firmicutes bacterium]|nr:ABC transporter ATP-binding protein [Bacillota bacterium]
MIETKDLCKSFGDLKALDHVSVSIRSGGVFGLVGSNGAGKSTFLRLLSGIYRPDSGSVEIDGKRVYENQAVKSRLVFIADDPYFFPNATPREMEEYYRGVYAAFDGQRFRKFLTALDLDAGRKISAFSKGMKKQLAVLLALCTNVPYLYGDETMDGLDPVMRRAVKSLFAEEVAARGLTAVLSSHNLRELEDICDHIGLLHRGGLLLAQELDELKSGLHKVQAVFPYTVYPKAFEGMQLTSFKQSGRMYTMIFRGDGEEIRRRLEEKEPVYMEMLPVSLEEAFIYETEVAGYDFQTLFL